jgi:hypothetical protein
MNQMRNKADIWSKYRILNYYYHSEIQKFVQYLIPPEASILEFSSRGGELLASLPNKNKVGIEFDDEIIKYAKRKYPKIEFINFENLGKKLKERKFDYIILSHTSSDIDNLQSLLRQLKKYCYIDTRIIVSFFNFLWKPALDVAEHLSLKTPSVKEPNWLTGNDVDNLFYLESYEKIKSSRRFLFPYKIPIISKIINNYISQLPVLNYICLNNFTIYKPLSVRNELSVSIIIPARNEEGNMQGILNKIPLLGKRTEVIFVEGHSKDKTYDVIKKEIRINKRALRAKLYKQIGVGKGDAVRLGFSKATNDLLMILDADLTVDPKELSKFYDAIVKGKGDLIMGSRLVYPMEKQAMRGLNYLGNKFFSLTFSFLLEQKIKDTLCGTKVILTTDYEKIKKNRRFFGNFDPFGDFDLIFGASKLNLKIVEIPIRYKERTYGTTNISRFKHGLLLFKMCYFAAKRIKFV